LRRNTEPLFHVQVPVVKEIVETTEPLCQVPVPVAEEIVYTRETLISVPVPMAEESVETTAEVDTSEVDRFPLATNQNIENAMQFVPLTDITSDCCNQALLYINYHL
jgi:hypothetical protein